MTIPDRHEILRIDCVNCSGNGYISEAGAEKPCPTCGGVGMREKKVPYRAEGYDYKRDADEIARIFGVRSFNNKRDKDDPAND